MNASFTSALLATLLVFSTNTLASKKLRRCTQWLKQHTSTRYCKRYKHHSKPCIKFKWKNVMAHDRPGSFRSVRFCTKYGPNPCLKWDTKHKTYYTCKKGYPQHSTFKTQKGSFQDPHTFLKVYTRTRRDCESLCFEKKRCRAYSYEIREQRCYLNRLIKDVNLTGGGLVRGLRGHTRMDKDYVGCFRMKHDPRNEPVFLKNKATPSTCAKKCTDKKFVFAALSHGHCICTNDYGKYGAAKPSQCGVRCIKDKRFYCGGHWNKFYEVYRLKIPYYGYIRNKGTYITFRQKDYPGNDLRMLKGVPKSICQNACENDRRCKLYSYFFRGKIKGECYLKHTIGEERPSPNIIGGIKYRQKMGRFDVYQGSINPSQTIAHSKVKNLKKCITMCSRFKGCMGFTYASKGRSRGSCWLKKSKTVHNNSLNFMAGRLRR